MISVLFQSLALASAGLLAPGAITLVILLLVSDRRGRNGVAFALGYIVVYLLIGVGVLVSGVNSAEFTPKEQSPTLSFILIGLGIILLLVTMWNWRNKPQLDAQNRKHSRFTKLVNGITPLKSFILAAIFSIFNLKNVIIFLSAVSVLLLSDLHLITKLTILLPLVLIFCISVIIPVTIYLVAPDRATDYLNRIKDVISGYSRPFGLATMLILGVLLCYHGISGLL